MIFVLRHGETIWNLVRRRQGRRDSPLTLRGVKQAVAYAERLRREIARGTSVEVISSPLGRARQTASIVCESLELDPNKAQLDPLLAEHDFGEWEGLVDEEIEAAFPGALAERRKQYWDYRIPGGECYAEVFERAGHWLQRPTGARITIAITHAMTSRALRGAYLNLHPEQMVRFVHPQDRFYRLAGGRVEEVLCDVDAAPAHSCTADISARPRRTGVA